MANTKIQIRRTSVPGKVPNTSNIDTAELALNLADGILYSSNGSSIFAIGANNTNVYVTGILTVNTINANGSIGEDSQVLTSNGSTVYWSTKVGYTGSQGPIGYTGSQGDLGYTGSAGTNGYTGSQGDVGYTGSQGIQGVIGYAGSQGPIGYAGSASTVIGYTGSAGANGYTGSQGKITTDASVPPTSAYEGQIWFDSENIKTYVYYDSYWVEIGGSDIGNFYTRNGFFATSDSLLNNGSQNINISGYKSYVLMSISTSHAAWIRFYSDQASRTADETRNINTDPIAGSGVIAEFVTTGNQTQKVTPFIFGGNLESVPTDDLYMRVTNLSGVTTQININVLLIRLEF